MRILVQRVFQAWVRVEGQQISRIKEGVLVLVGITSGDTIDVVEHMANKTLNMRLWDKQGKNWNASVMDIKGQIMAVSQFTLYGIMKGNKPDFHGAMQAQEAKILFQKFINVLKKKYDQKKVQTGKFQHLMQVGSINNGPVTIHYEKMAQQKKPNPKDKVKTSTQQKKVQQQANNNSLSQNNDQSECK